ncbi:hypothetical protein IDH44_10995 [Paenibacillus sp. IB182496]|uniref:Uncharacterized protein n=1 Tax=Paenibacillus sabuli TaxID=2772509 RepID=A0A927GSH4_9BACL|nr:hypothetical protein [Paenibacillus sabuli]MBD2845717.1 hypothetical protein [Paenibacillus sabuli]
MLFSMLESVAMLAIMLSLFRYRIGEYMHYYMLAALLLSVFSHLLWSAGGRSDYLPAGTVLLSAAAIRLRTSIGAGASLLVACTGYLAYGTVQSLVVCTLHAAGWIDLARLGMRTGDTYLMQTCSSGLLLVLGRLQYRSGLGFTFRLRPLRWNRGDAAVLCVLGAALLLLALLPTLVEGGAALATVLLTTLLGVLLYTLHREERRHVGEAVGPAREPD